MARNGETIEIDRGYRALMASLKEMRQGPHVRVGFFEGSQGGTSGGEAGGATIAQYMLINELGVRDPEGGWRIPPRPAMQRMADEQRGKVAQMMREGLARIATGRGTPRGELARVGLHLTASLVRKITSLREPANAASTIRGKGSSNPLIDSGAARNAVEFKVVDRDGGKLA